MLLFSSTAPSILSSLWNDKEFTDVTLATADNKTLEAHKAVLNSCSLFFRNIFKMNQHTKPLLYFHNIDQVRIEKILQFIYLGKVEVGECDVDEFISLGTTFGLVGLEEGKGCITSDYLENDCIEQLLGEGYDEMSAKRSLTKDTQEIRETDNISRNTSEQSFLLEAYANQRKLKTPNKTAVLGITNDAIHLSCNLCEIKVHNETKLKEHNISLHEDNELEMFGANSDAGDDMFDMTSDESQSLLIEASPQKTVYRKGSQRITANKSKSTDNKRSQSTTQPISPRQTKQTNTKCNVKKAVF